MLDLRLRNFYKLLSKICHFTVRPQEGVLTLVCGING